MMKYVLLDTNIFVRFVTQGNPGCEVEYWERLKEHVAKGSAQLLICEVVKLEVEGQLHDIQKKIEDGIATFIDKLSKIDPSWNELNDLKPALIEKCKEFRSQKIIDVKKRIEEVDSFFYHKRAIQVSFDSEVMLMTKRRTLRGRGLAKTERLDADLLIIDSLHKLFGKMSSEERILFCTENIKHFGVTVNGVNVLAPKLREDLAYTQLFTNLQSLIDALDDPSKIIQPSDQAVESAVEANEEYPHEAKALFKLMVEMGDWEHLRSHEEFGAAWSRIYREFGNLLPPETFHRFRIAYWLLIIHDALDSYWENFIHAFNLYRRYEMNKDPNGVMSSFFGLGVHKKLADDDLPPLR